MATMPNDIEVRVDLAALAAGLSRADGDGHHWDEDEACQWLWRMGYDTARVAPAGGAIGWVRGDAHLMELLGRPN